MEQTNKNIMEADTDREQLVKQLEKQIVINKKTKTDMDKLDDKIQVLQKENDYLLQEIGQKQDLYIDDL